MIIILIDNYSQNQDDIVMDSKKLPLGHAQDVLIEPRKPLPESSLRELLTNCGLKITNQRLAILKTLNSGPRAHMTAQDILDEVKKTFPPIGFATVYRLLKVLSSHGLITEISMGSGSSRYELKSKTFHYHISCVQCGKLVEFKNRAIESALEGIIKEKNFEMQHQILELYVRCTSSQCVDQIDGNSSCGHSMKTKIN